MVHQKDMRAVWNAAPLVLLLLAVSMLAFSKPAAEDRCDAGCEPRSTKDPGRLNVTLDANDYGVMPPCTADLNLYIARNTPLQSLHGVIQMVSPDGGILQSMASRITLEHTDRGLLAAQLRIPADPTRSCRSLSVRLKIENCQGEDGTRIACPDVRVKVPQMFDSLSVVGDGLNICYDD